MQLKQQVSYANLYQEITIVDWYDMQTKVIYYNNLQKKKRK